MNSSSSPAASQRLVRVPLERLHPHPANANLMSEERLAKLARNIEREGRYPPLIARPHPQLDDQWQLLDGHQRLVALQRLGHAKALVFSWPCDDATALVLLATLNRLEGADVPGKRAELLEELETLLPREELALLLPEDGVRLEETLGLLALDTDALFAELEAQAAQAARVSPRVISFAVLPEDEAVVEEAIAQAAADLDGRDRRGRALAAICRAFLEGHRA